MNVNSVAKYSLANHNPIQTNISIRNISNKDNLGIFISVLISKMRKKLVINHLFVLFVVLSLPYPSLMAQPDTKPEGPANTEEEYQKRYNENITKDRLHGVYIPKNLDDAFVQLDKNISAESREKIKAIPEDTVCLLLHDRLGRWMLNNWCFYEGSRFSHYLRSAGVTYPDDMADFMLIAYHRHLHGKPVELRELAKSYRETRKKAFIEEKKEGKVIKEEVKKKNKD
jgi:hypothetical protein